MKFHFPKLKKSKRTLKKKSLYNPSRDWRVILITSAIFLAIIILIHWFVYIQTKNGKFFNKAAEERETHQAIQREKLEEVTSYFESKKQLFSDIKENPEALSDPSL